MNAELMRNLILYWSHSKINYVNVLFSGSSGLLAGLVVVGVIVGLVLLVGAVVVYCKCFKKENKGEEQKMFLFSIHS